VNLAKAARRYEAMPQEQFEERLEKVRARAQSAERDGDLAGFCRCTAVM
jgi:hypothetical protein